MFSAADTNSLTTQTVVTAVPLTTNATTYVGITNQTTTIYPVASAITAYANGKCYSSADTLDMTLNNAADKLKITISALCVSPSDAD